MTDNVNRLLVVDDEPGVVDFVGALGRKLGYTVATTPSGVEFLRLRIVICSGPFPRETEAAQSGRQ